MTCHERGEKYNFWTGGRGNKYGFWTKIRSLCSDDQVAAEQQLQALELEMLRQAQIQVKIFSEGTHSQERITVSSETYLG